jgi:hypothetical protein
VLTASRTVDAAIKDVTTARGALSKFGPPKVRRRELLDLLKSTAYTWFESHRAIILSSHPGMDLTAVDGHYNAILESTSRGASKSTYLNAFRSAKGALIAIRAATLNAASTNAMREIDDLAPDLSPLADNAQMREILSRRWLECCKCVNADAHLAAIVMMGGLLEALLIARANRLDDKAQLFTATSAPKDRASGRTLNLKEWTLDTLINVGCELKWITESGKNVADVLKNYRNYVHPEKELRHGIELGINDSTMFWQMVKALARQLLLSAARK